MGNFILAFFKGFLVKYLSTSVLEKLVIVILKRLVLASDSKVDDEIFETVFGKIEKEGK